MICILTAKTKPSEHLSSKQFPKILKFLMTADIFENPFNLNINWSSDEVG